MSPPIILSDLLLALEAALLALEDDMLCAPHARLVALVALVARRRRSVLVLRRHTGAACRSRRLPRRPHLNFEELIATEFRLARTVDALLCAAPDASTLRRDLEELRADVDEAALSLRLIAHHRGGAGGQRNPLTVRPRGGNRVSGGGSGPVSAPQTRGG